MGTGLHCTVAYCQSAPLVYPPPPPLFSHRKNWYRECAPPRLSAPLPPFFCISLLNCLFCKLEGANNGSLKMGIVLYQRLQHNHRSSSHHVSVTAVFCQWRGRDVPSQHRLSTSCSPWLPLTPVPRRSTTACTRSRTRSAI